MSFEPPFENNKAIHKPSTPSQLPEKQKADAIQPTSATQEPSSVVSSTTSADSNSTRSFADKGVAAEGDTLAEMPPFFRTQCDELGDRRPVDVSSRIDFYERTASNQQDALPVGAAGPSIQESTRASFSHALLKVHDSSKKITAICKNHTSLWVGFADGSISTLESSNLETVASHRVAVDAGSFPTAMLINTAGKVGLRLF